MGRKKTNEELKRDYEKAMAQAAKIAERMKENTKAEDAKINVEVVKAVRELFAVCKKCGEVQEWRDMPDYIKRTAKRYADRRSERVDGQGVQGAKLPPNGVYGVNSSELDFARGDGENAMRSDAS